jgi:outer membrane lipopolysaccharide assembly protein LptE/RlpB
LSYPEQNHPLAAPVAVCSTRGLVLKNLFVYLLLGIVCCSLSGCGYHAADWSSSQHARAGKTVAIPLFANRTFKPNLEAVLANALIDEFAKRSGLSVVPSGADLTLSGEVLSYSLTAISYSYDDTVKEYSAAMRITATLRKNSNRQILWKGELLREQAFPANTDIALQQNAEDEAIGEICSKLAQQVYVNLVEDF